MRIKRGRVGEKGSRDRGRKDGERVEEREGVPDTHTRPSQSSQS